MSVTVDEARALLRTIIRSIDRKADFDVSPMEGDQAGVTVNVSLRRYKTTLTVSAAKLEAAKADVIGRSQLRASLKRVIDRMTFESMPVASTKMLRGAVVEGGFFRTQQGGHGGRR